MDDLGMSPVQAMEARLKELEAALEKAKEIGAPRGHVEDLSDEVYGWLSALVYLRERGFK